MTKGLMIALSVTWTLLGAASVVVSLTSFFLFDAPGSESSRLTLALFYCLLALPAFWIVGAILPWCFRKEPWAGWLFAFPLIDVTAIVVVFVCINQFCGGTLSCK
jgi:hypothetical protein